jgi:hypothetical protein
MRTGENQRNPREVCNEFGTEIWERMGFLDRTRRRIQWQISIFNMERSVIIENNSEIAEALLYGSPT